MIEYEYPRPQVCVDIVLFTVRQNGGQNRLQVMLQKRSDEPYRGLDCLIGGVVHADDDIDIVAATKRILSTKCGVSNLFLEQLGTYGGLDRDPRGWSVSIVYYALVSEYFISDFSFDDNVSWVDVDDVGEMGFDHAKILFDAVGRLRGKATYTTLPLMFLPSKFTFRELEEMYEVVLGRDVYTASFRRKMLDLSIDSANGKMPLLRETSEFRHGKGRSSILYEKSVDFLVSFPQRF